MKRVWLFLLVCAVSGLMTVIGSILGNAFGKTGLMVGAVAGGLIGVAVATAIASWRQLIQPGTAGRVFMGGAAGFIIAALIAGNNLWTPIIPVLSTALIGAGALLGERSAQR